MLPVLSTVVRHLSDSSSTDLKAILSEKIKVEEARVKNFRKGYGSTSMGEVTVDMVSFRIWGTVLCSPAVLFIPYCNPVFLHFLVRFLRAEFLKNLESESFKDYELLLRTEFLKSPQITVLKSSLACVS